MTSPHPTAVILLAGGSGSRMGADEAKQFIRIAGKPILVHTYEALRRHMPDAPMVVTVPLESIARVRAMLPTDDAHVQVVIGGSSRQMSTLAGLRALRAQQPHNVLIHDAARPFVSGQIIHDVLQALEKDEAVDVAIPTADTIIVERDGYIQSIPKRTHLRRGQTPQAFRYETLMRCYDDVGEERLDQFTDDCGIYLDSTPFGQVRVVAGHEENIKLTSPVDLVLADEIFRMRSYSLSSDALGVNLQGKRALIFGGTKGIGKALAQVMQDAGAHVVARARGNGCDVRDRAAVAQAVRDAEGELGGLDYVINSAGLLSMGALSEASEEDVRSLIDVNLLGALWVSQASFDALARSQGMLVQFASSSYTRGRKDYVAYSAAKAATVNLVQGLSEEWAEAGVRVNCVVPPRTDTPMRRDNFQNEDASTLMSPFQVALATTKLLVSAVSGQVLRAE